MKLKYLDGFMGFVIGDAMGVPTKSQSREKLLKSPVTKMLSSPSLSDHEGTWSDATSMMIATLDSINAKNGIDYYDIALKFAAFKNHASYTPYNETTSICITCAKAIDKFEENHDDPLTCGMTDSHSNDNGSLMRILPIAYYSLQKKLKDYEIRDLVKAISSITHAHEISQLGCYIYVRFAMFLLTGKDKYAAYNMTKSVDYSMYSLEAQESYHRLIKEDIRKLKINEIKSSSSIVDSLEACIWVFLQSQNYKEAIIGAINLGDDTNTIGALTGALAGIIYGYDFIPEEWKDKIARREYLLDIIEEFSENTYV